MVILLNPNLKAPLNSPDKAYIIRGEVSSQIFSVSDTKMRPFYTSDIILDI